MASSKIRARLNGGVTTVKALIIHPMETGNRKNPRTGEMIPRHFIRELTCERNDTVVMTALWGWGVSTNPYVSFQLVGGRKGDRIRITWVDNTEARDVLETLVR